MLASYLARIGLTLAGAPRRGPAHPLEEVRLPMRVWPTDIDFYFHLNNGRYLTLMDIGRLELGLRTGLAKATLQRGWAPVAAAATVRFRRELKALAAFELTSRIAAWDDRWLYVEHRMLRGETLHTWGAVKVAVRHKGARVTPAEYVGAVGVTTPSPEPEGELAKWIDTQRANG